MKGNNTLILNQATMVEALQEYLDKLMGASVKVESIEKTNSAVPGAWPQGTDGFVVRVTEKGVPRDPVQHKL